MTARTAPYRHADGSNCWTKNCSRNHPADVGAALDRWASEIKTSEVSSQVPAHLVWSGGKFHSEYRLVTTHKKSFDSSLFRKPKNTEGEGTWTKPLKGLWAARMNDDGGDEWNTWERRTPLTKELS